MSRIDGAAVGDPEVSHPSTIIGGDHRYACHNRADWAPAYTVRVREFEPGSRWKSGRRYRTAIQVVGNEFTRACAHAVTGAADRDPACRECLRLGSGLLPAAAAGP